MFEKLLSLFRENKKPKFTVYEEAVMDWKRVSPVHWDVHRSPAVVTTIALNIVDQIKILDAAIFCLSVNRQFTIKVVSHQVKLRKFFLDDKGYFLETEKAFEELRSRALTLFNFYEENENELTVNSDQNKEINKDRIEPVVNNLVVLIKQLEHH